MSHTPELMESMRKYLDRFNDAGLRAVAEEDPATQPEGMSWDQEVRALATSMLAERAAHAKITKELAEDNERERLQREANIAERHALMEALSAARPHPMTELTSAEGLIRLMPDALADSAREAEQARLNQQEPVDVPGSTP